MKGKAKDFGSVSSRNSEGTKMRRFSLAADQDGHPRGSSLPRPPPSASMRRKGSVFAFARMGEPRNSISLSFKDKDVELSFERHQHEIFGEWWRRLVIMIVFITLLLLVAPVAMFMDSKISKDVFANSLYFIFLGVALPFILAFLTTYRQSIFRKFVQHMSAALVLLAGLFGVILIYYVSKQYNNSATSITLFSLIFSSILLPLRVRFVYCFCCTVPLTIVQIAMMSAYTTSYDANFAVGIIYLIVICVVMNVICYDQELILRNQFTHSENLIRHNAKLRDQLSSLKDDYSNKVADFDSPLEKVNSILHSLLADSTLSEDQLATIQIALSLINSSNVLQPDLENQIKEGQVRIDESTEAWLFTELAQRETYSLFHQRNKEIVKNPAPITDDWLFDGLELSAEQIAKAKELLPRTNTEFNFPMMEFDEVTNHHPLSILVCWLFDYHGLITAFDLHPHMLRSYFLKIENGYRPNPYHNAMHAADVLQAMNYFLNNSGMKTIVNEQDRFICYMAAAIHDFDHPGLSNIFQVNASTAKAIVYNDRSVLENHHLAASFLILENPELNFLSALSKETFRAIRSGVIELVLATDLAQHFKILSQFKAKRQGEGFDFSKTEDRLLLMQMALKCADVCNGAKQPKIYHKWTEYIMEEFYRQGDEEKKLGLPISPFCDRQSTKVAQCQCGFLEFICLPLFEAFDQFVIIPDIYAQIQENTAYWKAHKDV